MTVKKAVGDSITIALGTFLILVILDLTSAIASPIIYLQAIVPLIIFALMMAFHEPLLELLNINISI